jgi:hypothetical protein
LLATGSGATFTSAAFQSSTQPDSDLRVVVDQNLQFGANPDLDEERDDIATDGDFFEDGSDSGNLDEGGDGPFNDDGDDFDGENPDDDDNDGEPGSGDEPGRDGDADGSDDRDDTDEDGNGFNEGFEPGLPKAFVEGVNDELTIKAAVQIGNTHTFEELLRLGNGTEETVEVGIAYDRNSGIGNGENGNYGADVEGSAIDTIPGSNPDPKLAYDQAQKIYQFQLSNSSDGASLISPNPGDDGNTGDFESGSIEIDDASDAPNALIRLEPGSFVDIDLVVNTSNEPGDSKGTGNLDADTANVEQDILNAANIDQGAFGFQTDTVQIMDAITVVSQPES